MLCVGLQLHLMLALHVGAEGAELLLFLLQPVDISHRQMRAVSFGGQRASGAIRPTSSWPLTVTVCLLQLSGGVGGSKDQTFFIMLLYLRMRLTARHFLSIQVLGAFEMYLLPD